MATFKAGVQYDDWVGTAAADNADAQDFLDHLKESGVLGDEEFLIGVELWVGENHGGEVAEPYVSALIFHRSGFDNVAEELRHTDGEIPVRKVDLDMSLTEFLGRFKRFSVMLTRKGLDLTGREYMVQA